MKRCISGAVLLCAATCFSSAAFALELDEQYGISFEIPPGDGVYYLTPDGGNLFGDLREKLASKEENARFFVSRYTPENDNAYSILIYAAPRNDAAVAPLSPDGFFTQEYKDEALSEAEFGDAQGYVFTPPADAAAGGRPALLITASNKDAGRKRDIYVVPSGADNIIIEAEYGDAIAPEYYAEMEGALSSLEIKGDNAENAQTPSPALSPEIITETVEPQRTPTPGFTLAPLPPEQPKDNSPSGGNFFESARDTLLFALENDPNFKFYLIGAGAALFAVIFAAWALVKRARRRADSYGGEYGDDPAPDDGAYAAYGENPYDTDYGYSEREGYQDGTDVGYEDGGYENYGGLSEDGGAYNESDAAYAEDDETQFFSPQYYTGGDEYDGGLTDELDAAYDADAQDAVYEEDEEMFEDADFEEDFSKYTRQPGRDVNDVSKNTIGGYDTDEITREISRAALENTGRQPWRTQGTRMERRKNKKK